MAIMVHEYFKLWTEQATMQNSCKNESKTAGTSVQHPIYDSCAVAHKSDCDSRQSSNFQITEMGNDVKESIEREGSSVWCQGNDHSHRLCHFRHLCYLPAVENFVFLHGVKSILYSVPQNRFNPALLQLSAVHGHNALNFNYVDLPVSNVSLADIKYIQGKTLMLKRFNPDNIMHVFHDDLIPIYHTLLLIHGAAPSHGSPYSTRLLFLDNFETETYLNLYQTLSSQTIMMLKDLQEIKQSLVCFEDLHVGISRSTLWYQYGFQEPQGPLTNPVVSAIEIKHFTDYFYERLSIKPQVQMDDYLVLFSRKLNRMILNEMELAITLAQELGMKVLTIGAETHSVSEIISYVSSASIIVGMHGSLLSYSIFLKPGAIVVELYPYGVNPDNYTPYKTLANLKGMNIIYKSWRNLDIRKTLTHPDSEPQFGGIVHLSQKDQERIQASPEIGPHLCCSNPEWLYRIYQDTIVDIQAVVSLTRIALNERRDLTKNNLDYTNNLYPSQVMNLSCSNSTSTKLSVKLHLSWDQPLNLQFVTQMRVKYEVWIQPVGSKDYTAWILSKQSHTFSDGLHPDTTYMIWVRCLLNDLTGPFNQDVLKCDT